MPALASKAEATAERAVGLANEKEWADDNGSRCSRQKRMDDEYLAR
jgi:hypothetical protein